VRDCFDKSTGTSVDKKGKKSNSCFKRRKTGEEIKALFKTDQLIKELRGKIRDREITLTELKNAGFKGATVHYYEDLMASEMDKRKLDKSVEEWKGMMSEFGFSFSSDSIRTFLSKKAGSYPATSSHADTIYNFDDVKKTLKQDSSLSQFLRTSSEAKGNDQQTDADDKNAEEKDSKDDEQADSADEEDESDDDEQADSKDDEAEEDESDDAEADAKEEQSEEEDEEDKDEESDADSKHEKEKSSSSADPSTWSTWKRPKDRTPEERKAWHDHFDKKL
jgi:cobalamin biosynthesis protein CobT